MRRGSAWVLIGIVIAFAACCATAVAGSSGAPVLLGKGRVGDRLWFASVEGSKRSMDVSAPCANILLRDATEGSSPETEFTEDITTVCGRLYATEPPMVLSVGVDERTSKRGEVFSILAASNVSLVRLSFSGRGTRGVRMKRIAGSRATIAGVAPLRYAAFGKAGTECLTRVASFDAKGRKTFDSGREGCQKR